MNCTICSCGNKKHYNSKQCRECRWKEPLHKVCTGCNKAYSIDHYAFRPDGRGGKKRRSQCRSCEAKYTREHRAKNPELHKNSKKLWEANNPEKHYRQSLRNCFRKLGLDATKGIALYDAHSKKCDICKKSCSSGKRLAIDHDHHTGEFRGFLCSNCNQGLGRFKDDLQLLLKAVTYIKSHLKCRGER